MSDIAVEVSGVYKKFHRGELHDSLRDMIPAMARRLIGRGPKRDELAEDDFWALKDVSFQVKRGEVLGIIGANGAGKSTLLKILAKILRPNRGSMRVNGRLRALIEIAAGFHGDLTGRENVYLNGSILGMKKREIDAKFDEIVAFSGIEEFLDTPVKRYSSGMYARLGFAVAANLEPEILIVDEVLAVGDAEFQKKCLGKMSDVAGQGRTVLFVSHNMTAVKRLCPRTVYLKDGELVVDGPTHDVIHQYIDKGERTLVSTATYPPDESKSLQILATAIVDPDGEPIESPYDLNHPFSVRLTYGIRRPLLAPWLTFFFRDEDGQAVAFFDCRDSSTGPESISFEPGEHRVQITLPAGMLNAGKYTLCVGSRDRTDLLDAVTLDVNFSLHDPSSGRRAHRPGYTGVKPAWEPVGS